MAEKFTILEVQPEREILTVTPDGYFIRGEHSTDEEYLDALEKFNELGIEWRGGQWLKA